MAPTKNRSDKKRTSASWLVSSVAAAFATAAVATQSLASGGVRSDFNEGATCTTDLTQDNVRGRTGYSNLENLLLATAYKKYMEEQGADPRALIAILQASEETGVDFELMLVKAIIESGLGRHDKPLHIEGGARGLYQYLPATWMTVFSQYGEQYNNGQYADLARAVKFDAKDNPYMTDSKKREELLALRSNHEVAAFIKAMQIKNEEEPFLRTLLNRDPAITDYYLAHFLGLPRAEVFFENLTKNPNKAAADVMPREAKYNRGVFYDGKKKRSFQDIYDRLTRIMDTRLANAHAEANTILAREGCLPALQNDAPAPAAPAAEQVPSV